MNETPPKKTCGTCLHMHAYSAPDNARGQCYRHPPTVYAGGDHRRPVLKLTEPACGEHEEGTPEVKAKTQPETPGLAAKVARQGKGKVPA